jgi:hypothetical protein
MCLGLARRGAARWLGLHVLFAWRGDPGGGRRANRRRNSAVEYIIIFLFIDLFIRLLRG